MRIRFLFLQKTKKARWKVVMRRSWSSLLNKSDWCRWYPEALSNPYDSMCSFWRKINSCISPEGCSALRFSFCLKQRCTQNAYKCLGHGLCARQHMISLIFKKGPIRRDWDRISKEGMSENPHQNQCLFQTAVLDQVLPIIGYKDGNKNLTTTGCRNLNTSWAQMNIYSTRIRTVYECYDCSFKSFAVSQPWAVAVVIQVPTRTRLLVQHLQLSTSYSHWLLGYSWKVTLSLYLAQLFLGIQSPSWSLTYTKGDDIITARHNYMLCRLAIHS